jgi:hypothetical protein
LICFPIRWLIAGVGKVNAAFFAKDSLGTLVEHGSHQPHHFLKVNRFSLESPQLTFDADDWRAANSHVQITSIQLHHGLEDFVDLDFSIVNSMPL